MKRGYSVSPQASFARKSIKQIAMERLVERLFMPCDICKKPIEPPGTGSCIGADGLLYCSVCRNKLAHKEEVKL
jgi:hypothetical protein